MCRGDYGKEPVLSQSSKSHRLNLSVGKKLLINRWKNKMAKHSMGAKLAKYQNLFLVISFHHYLVTNIV